MERANGSRPLLELILRGPVPMNQAVKIARAIGEQLAPLHARGQTVGLLDPSHVMLFQNSERVQVRIPEHDALIASVSPHYTPPERVRGQSEGPASDVYALGVMLYHMITGVPPFDADTTDAILQLHLLAPLPGLSQNELQDVPEALERLVQRMLAKSPAERPAVSQTLEIIDNLELDSTIMGVRLQNMRDLARAVREEQAEQNTSARPKIDPDIDPYGDTFIRNRADFDLEIPTKKPEPGEDLDAPEAGTVVARAPTPQQPQVSDALPVIGPDPDADGAAATMLNVPKMSLPQLPKGPIKAKSNAADTQILSSDELHLPETSKAGLDGASSSLAEKVSKAIFVTGVGLLIAAIITAVISFIG